MATARLYIPIGTQTYGPIPGGSDITEAIGSNEFETVKIAGDGNVLLDASFVRGNDCLVIQGASADYLISSSVAGLTLTGKTGTDAEGAIIRIPAFAAGGGLKLDFTDVTDVDLITTDGTVFTLVGPDGNQTVTGTPTALTIGDTSGNGGGNGGSSEVIELTVAADNLTGGSGNTTFESIISVNQNGEQTNTLQTGDRLNGGGGYNTLDAEVQDASALNGRPVAEVALRTTRVDHIMINAQQANSSSDVDAVEIDAERAYGVQKFTSSYSDASLVIYNINTMGDGGLTDPVNGQDNGRPTASLTFCMDHTSGENVLYCASDFEAYIDADYLIPGLPSSGTELRLQLLDIDNQITNNQPLLTNPFDRIFITLAGEADPVVVVIAQAKNGLSGAPAYQALANSINAGLAAAGLTTFTATVTEQFTVIDPDGTPGGQASGFEITITDSSGSAISLVEFGASGSVPANTDYQKQIFVDTETEFDLITANLCVLKVGSGTVVGQSADGGDFIVGSMTNYGVERFILEVKGYDAGTGGVNVDQDSSLASLASTNNSLREVILTAADDVTADLIIGNANTEGMVPNIPYYMDYYNVSLEDSIRYDDEYCGNFYPDGNPCDLTTNRNNALRDVQLFDATGLPSAVDVTLWASLTSAYTQKYLDLMDVDPEQSQGRYTPADNIQASYLFGGGDDTLNINISKNNFAFSGAITREDFSFYTDTGAGDDLVQVQLGDGMFGEYGRVIDTNLLDELEFYFSDSNHWYTNHLLNQNLVIITGAGADKVETWGSTAAYIELGGGADIAFTDNSGGGTKKGPSKLGSNDDFNCCRATWVFNAQSDDDGNEADVNDLLSFGRASVSNVYNVSLYVQYQDFIVQVEIGDSIGSVNGITLTDLLINQAIKDAVNNNPTLSAFLEAKDGPSGTLLVLSKVDGQHLEGDFSISIGRSTNASGQAIQLTAAQQASTTGRYWDMVSPAQQTALGFAANGQPLAPSDYPLGTGARWDSEFGYDRGKELDGVDSMNVNNNRVYAGPGNDNVALSSNYTSIEHYIIKPDENFGVDHVLNFTAAIADAIIPAETEVQELCFDVALNGEFPVTSQPANINLEFDRPNASSYVLTVFIPQNSSLDQINTLVRDAINNNGNLSGIDAVIRDDDCLEITYPTGYDLDDINVALSAVNPTEVQYIDVTGDQDSPSGVTTISITVPGLEGNNVFSITIPQGSSLTDTQIAQQLAAAIDAHPLLTATAGAVVGQGDGVDIITINSFSQTNIGEAFGQVASAAVNVNLTNTDPTNDSFTPFNPGITFTQDTLNDGAPTINPALGYDIFDISAILGRAGPEGGQFENTMQDNSSGAEYGAVDRLVDSGLNGVAIIDTLDGNGAPGNEFAYSSANLNELQRLQEMVTAADQGANATAQVGADRSVIITVRDLPGDADGTIGTFYQLDDAAGAGNATVKYLGTVYLGGYDLETVDVPGTFKDPIGDWNAMTIANFTYQTPEQLMQTYIGGTIA